MKGFCPLASGSKGNCLYLGTSETKILIDAGLSAKSTQEKLALINVDLADIDALLISHEHSDHIAGLKTLASKYGIPILANQGTARGIIDSLQLTAPKFKIFSTGEPFEYGDIQVLPFTIPHDTLDPVAFIFRIGSIKLGVCTDLGFASSLVQHHLHDCDYLYIEANHKPSMVHACARPDVYKKRVLSRNGHLSNEACGQLLEEIATPRLKKVYLAHLSSECNSPEVALATVSPFLAKAQISCPLLIAPQHTLSESVAF